MGIYQKIAELAPATVDFYRTAMLRLGENGVPFLLGGAYALSWYTGFERQTKDLDIFIRPADCERTLTILAEGGYATELTFSHWLAKAFCGDDFIDIIFNSGNGVARVDALWFKHALDGEVFGVPIKICPPEEMIWSKAFIMERERFDGADVIHIIKGIGQHLDWQRLLERFGDHWPVLMSHLVLFTYVYPDDKDNIPAGLLRELAGRLQFENNGKAHARVCRGTLLSRSQYLIDTEKWGYQDARALPHGSMTHQQTAYWSRAGEWQPYK